MQTPVSISKEPLPEPAMDYRFLRQEGIKHIGRLTGHVWSDYNIHDPGITILEYLCYAITDLSYRIDHGVKDLLANADGSDPYQSLYSPEQILTVNPVTYNDLRKLIIDIKGVRNAWVEAADTSAEPLYYDETNNQLSFLVPEGEKPMSLKGFYRVLVESNPNDSNFSLEADIWAKLQAHRNICKQCVEVKVLQKQNVAVQADIEIGEVEDADQLLTNIYYEIACTIAPRINRYTLTECLDKGKPIEEIFSGPVMQRGFIDDEELLNSQREDSLRNSDVIQAIMNVNGIKAIKNIRLVSGNTVADWVLSIGKNQTPEFDLSNTVIKLYNDQVEASVDMSKVQAAFQALMQTEAPGLLAESDKDVIPDKGVFREVETYYSIQKDLPDNYGIGSLGLPLEAGTQRQAKALQLKAYLSFFEQLLANLFSQAARAKNLFSFQYADIKSYFSQVPGDIPNLGDILDNVSILNEDYVVGASPGPGKAIQLKNKAIKEVVDNQIVDAGPGDFTVTPDSMINKVSITAYDVNTKTLTVDTSNCLQGDKFSVKYHTHFEQTDDFKLKLDELIEDENTALERKNRFLNHLMARFSEQFTDYSLLLFEADREASLKRLAQDKLSFLQQYPAISAGRGQAFNLSQNSWNTDNVSGFKNRLCKLLGIANIKNTVLSGTQTEGFYIVEHLLLYPPVHDTNDPVPFMSLQYPVTAFSDSANAPGISTTCTVPGHSLNAGDKIEITGSTNFNGIYTVSELTRNTFDIGKTYVDLANETGFWKQANQRKDPYSLQLSFIFPDWPGRFSDINFRKLVEKTIRSEVPAHINIHIYWLPALNKIPSDSWLKADIQVYMTANSIAYSNSDTKTQLLAKIPLQTSIEEFEQTYQEWLLKLNSYTAATQATKQDSAFSLLYASNALATLMGLGRVLPFAEGFAHTLSLNGVDQYVGLQPESIPAGQMITISFWALGGASLPANTSLIYAEDAGNIRTVCIHLPWSDGKIVFDCGNDGNTYDRIEKQAEADDYKNSWVHWAFTKDVAAGVMKIYKNGLLWHEGSGKSKAVPASASARLGADSNGTNHFTGQIAGLSIWNTARTQDEIRRDMNRRLTGTETGLTTYLKLDESLGNLLIDASTGLKHGTLSHFLAAYKLSFNGTDVYATADTVSGAGYTAGLTMECWMKVDNAAAGTDYILSFNTANGDAIVLGYKASDTKFTVGGDQGEIFASTKTFAKNTWYHMAVTLATNTENANQVDVTLYVNGVKEDTGVAGTGVWPQTNDRFSIGQKWNSNVAADFLHGQMVDVRVWSRPLQESEIKKGMTRRLSGTEPGLVSYWKMEEGSGTSLTNAVSGATQAQLVGGVAWI